MCTHKVNESINTLHTAEEETTAQQVFAAVADRSNSNRSSTQKRRRRGSGGGQLRASKPLIVHLMTPCLGGCALFGSVTCVLYCLSAVLCHVCSVLLIGCLLL